jgi:hypothetical protein
MLFRTGRQLDFLLGATELPPVLLCPAGGDGLAECMAYAAYNTPAFAEANYGYFEDVVTVLRARVSAFYVLPAGNVLADATEWVSQVNENQSNPAYRDREIEIRAFINDLSGAPFIFVTFQPNGHASYVPISHDEFDLTTIIAGSKRRHSLVGRCTPTAWYSYQAGSGIAAIHHTDARRHINRMANPANQDEGTKIYLMYQKRFSGDHMPPSRPVDDALLQMYTASEQQILSVATYKHEDPQTDSRIITRRIVNLHNTCYINASMQLLARMTGLKDVEQHDSVIPSFLLEMLTLPHEYIIRPDPLFITQYGNPTALADRLRISEQEDPAIFLAHIDSYENDVGKFFKENVMFETYREGTADCTCHSCGRKIREPEPTGSTLILSIDAKNASNNLNVNLTKLLMNYQKAKKGLQVTETESVTLPKHMCNINTSGTTIGRFSRYILIQFQKAIFGFDNDHTFVLKDSNGTGYKFKITAILMHRGTKAGGHYVTMAPNKNNMIVIYDDDKRFGPFATFFDACNEMLYQVHGIKDLYTVITERLEEVRGETAEGLPYRVR